MPEPVRIGVALALTGAYALLGRQVHASLRCFVDDVNGAGGIRVAAVGPRRPLQLIVRDDGSDPARCRDQVRALLRDERVDLLLGPYGSGPTRAAAAVAAEHHVVLWNHGGSAALANADHEHWCVNLLSPASDYFHGVIDAIAMAQSAPPRVVLFSARTGFADDVAAGVSARARAGACELVRHVRYATGNPDFAPLLGSIEACEADCLLGVGRIEDDLALALAIAARPPVARALGLVVAGVDEFRQHPGIALEGVIGPSQWEASVRYRPDCGPDARTFVERMRRYQDAPPDYPAAQAYAGALIAARCVEAAGTLAQPALREAAAHLEATTFYGRFRLDPHDGRQIGHEVLVTQWQDGHRHVVWPRDIATRPLRYPSARHVNGAGE